MTTKNIKERGFTLVELLIVIVIIAILTVVSLVAYNGLQDQARTSTAKSTADTVSKKVELYNTEEGSYPTNLAALSDTSLTSKSYYLTTSQYKDGGTAVDTKPSDPTTVGYETCGTDASGAKVTVWDFTNKKSYLKTLGTC